MLNGLPIIGWLATLIIYWSLSVPFWFCWTFCGIGQKYFSFLPTEWRSIPFIDCIGLCFCIAIAKAVAVRGVCCVSVTSESKKAK